jgi:poly(A) polymerase
VDSEAIGIVRRLTELKYDTYIVGGAVRDLILGKKPKDFDIVSSASPVRIKKIYHNSRIIGRRFRLVHVYSGQKLFEVSTFRSLIKGQSANTFGTIEEDARRRDFTMNSLFYDPLKQIVIDYTGGMRDIKKKTVVPVIPLDEIFSDDPVRMIRAVKYSVTCGFTLPLNVKLKIKKLSPLLGDISTSRLTEEIFKILYSPDAALIADSLNKFTLYRYLQPQAAKLMNDDPVFKGKYFQRLSAINRDNDEKKAENALIALFYDYLESIADWNVPIAENYRLLFRAARSFITPMAPPRFDLNRAIRNFFSLHGITLKRHHIALNHTVKKND